MKEQLAFPNQNRYSIESRPVRNIPTREPLQAAARREAQQQALYKAEIEADQSYEGHFAGIHPEHRPYISSELSPISTGSNAHTRASVLVDAQEAYDLEEDESYYTTRLPTSARRYQVSPAHVYQQGNQRLHVRYVDVPKRKSRQQQLPPERERQTEAYEIAPHSTRPGKRFHPLAWLGIFGIFLVGGWFGLNAVTSWYQGVQTDWTYGKQRHFEIAAVVGHHDSQATLHTLPQRISTARFLSLNCQEGLLLRPRFTRLKRS